ncbi:SurA N-terminal domain-containing protein [Endozoicomonas sp. SCSIO W0465]|uniref:SurA N-terminal domain-containing protein n=1 Tax=Endozoicomonas sp. SCSIO W0465 TaxID=2918516 RepID=UPI0020765B39|nr:SurA N-terminal domain-containing protein [Endozoicomonas sp. SCSIO W0465]USE39171.1 SurA N-terminal domain-containing protein [Endozoicomonas sp. SCSIO W0465]
MLQSMRDKAKSWVTFVVVGIIAFMMAITGLETLAPNPNNPEVASVNGKEITRAELAQAVDQQRRVLIQQMGGQFDPSMLDDQLLQSSVLDALIDRQLLLQSAEDQKMGIGEAQVDKLIVSMPQFQQNGRFDADRFQMMVRSYGMTPLQFRAAIREETLLLQLRAGVANTEFVTMEELKRLQSLEGQTRDLAWVVLPAEPVRKAITPSDEEITNYYQANSDQFMTPEQVVINYLVLNKGDIARDIEVSAEDIEAEYQYRVEQLKRQSGNNAQVSVILIQAGEDRTLDEAKARASDVVSQLKAGTSFAELAKSYSDDPMTAEKGGDLGVVEPGFFGDDFDQTVAGLEVGEVSDPMETDFGVQILKVTSRDEADLPTLSEMRADIAAALKQNEVDSLFIEQSRQLADISFEASDLDQPAEQLGLTVMTSEPFGRKGTASGIAADARIPAAAFSDDVLNLGANSELIEVTPEQAVVVRVKEHKKPEPIPLADVQDAIVTALKNSRAQQQLANRAEEMVTMLQSGKTLNLLADEQQLDVVESPETSRNMADVPAQLLQEAFKMPHPGNSVSYRSVMLANGDYAVVGLSAINPGEAIANNERLKGLGQFIASSNGRVTFDEYLASLKERGEVKVLLDSE